MKKFFQEKRLVIAVLLVLSILMPLVVSDTNTEVSVENSPPILLSQIPNQSWSSNENIFQVFDLDDYFQDANGDTLSFFYSTINQITLTIDSNNSVSFYPDAGFSGTKRVTFYASDSIYNTSSNEVYLFVGVDNSPPKWFSPSKDKSTIFQNDYINFTANWTDDKDLEKFIFSTNQTGTWENSSEVLFSGIQNISSQRIQISAPASTIVAWKFYAFDTSQNMNVTDMQLFTVSAQENNTQSPSENTPTSEEDKTFLEEILDNTGLLESKPEKDFKLDYADFKISLKQGNSRTSVLKITNVGTEELEFLLGSQGLEDFVFFSESSFILLPGESRQITVDFKVEKTTPSGQYFGILSVLAGGIKKEVSLVIEVNEVELEFDVKVSIDPKYFSIKPGKEVLANIEVLNLKDIVETNATLYLALKDLKGNIYDFSEETIIFSSNLELNKEFIVPEEALEGNYLFYARVSDEERFAIDSGLFEVGTRLQVAAFIRSSFIFISLFIAAVFLSFYMIRNKRNKKKERVLELYMELNKLKKMVSANKLEEALQVYLKIKAEYNEPITQEDLKDKEKLKKEILSLAGKYDETKKAIKEDEEKNKTEKLSKNPKEEKATPEKNEVKKEVKDETSKKE